uniref:Mpv17l_2 protein n=2 Tax=Fopius arisanus TaxID=64838 RepID=A0A0C9RLF8_9HYME
MSILKNIFHFVKKKPLIINSVIYGSFYTSAEFLQQTYKQQELKRENLLPSRRLTVAENETPLVVIGSRRNIEVDSNKIGENLEENGYNWSVLRRYIVYGYFLAGPILHGCDGFN